MAEDTNVAGGKIDGYEWSVQADECLGGWEMFYYQVYAPDDEEIESAFSETTELQDVIDTCKRIIEHHKNGDWR